jgi:hypothetical protein
MDATPTDTTTAPTVNESSPRANRAVPPPIPAAARAKRRVVSPPLAVHTLVADRDVVCLEDGQAAPRMLTFPPSPPLPRRQRKFDFKLFAAIVTLSSVSMAAGAGTGWASHAHMTSTHTPTQLVIETKGPRATTHGTTRSAAPVSRLDAPIATPTVTNAAITALPRPVASAPRRASARVSSTRSARVTTDGVTAPLPDLPMPGAVTMAQQRVRGAMIVCGMGVPNAAPTVRAQMTYSSDDSVRRVDLSAPWAGTEPGRCMENALRSRAIIPPFRSETFRTVFTFQAQ